MAGDLLLKIETTMVVTKTYFHDLHAPKWRLLHCLIDWLIGSFT